MYIGITENIYNTNPTQNHETVKFMDIENQWIASKTTSPDASFTTAFTNDLEPNEFFSRPILIGSYTWNISVIDKFYQALDVWSLFFQNKRVANRLTNYNLAHTNLHVKITINGNGFYFGKLIAHYVPLVNYDKVTVLDGLISENRILASQHLHVYIDPTTSQGGEIILPYLWSHDAINLPEGEFANLGKLYIREFVPLQHANGGTNPVNISVYAWAENMKLSCVTTNPISGLVAQADEYSTNPVSSTATAAAKIAGRLSIIPTIAPYAKATQIALNMVSGVAKAFGYSRPAIIQNVTPMIPQLIGPLANCDRGDNVTKLTVDSKQEITLDPRTLGLGSEDELSLAFIAAKETFLTSFNWNQSEISGTFKWNALVGPCYYTTASETGQVYVPSCTFAALPFKYWRGTMRYRFQVVSSNFHRGRLKIVWDPGFIATDESNVLFTRVIDIGENKEFVVDIGWANERSYLETRGVSKTTNYYSTTRYTSLYRYRYNGVIGVYILNELSTPTNITVDQNVAVNVFVSMQEAQFAVPISSNIETLTYLPNTFVATQSNEFDLETEANEPTKDSTEDLICTNNVEDHINDVYFGEHISSFRTLLKRYNLHSVRYIPSPTGTKIWYEIATNFPPFRGYTTSGFNTTPATPQNYCATTLMNYLAPAFCCYRGGIRYKYVLMSSDVSNSTLMSVTNYATEYIVGYNNDVAIDGTTNDTLGLQIMNLNQRFLNGSHITLARYQPTLEVELPFYANARFLCPKDPFMNTTTNYCLYRFAHQIHVVRPNGATCILRKFVAAGEDFSLNYYQGCPPFYYP